MNLFQSGDFTLSNGDWSYFKIECEALTDADWHCIAVLLAERLPAFGSVEGVPRGGLKLAECLEVFASSGPVLIVDDVLTTGASIERQRNGRDALGAVVFARRDPPLWITSLFTLTPKLRPR